jgi:hypothetical protein
MLMVNGGRSYRTYQSIDMDQVASYFQPRAETRAVVGPTYVG